METDVLKGQRKERGGMTERRKEERKRAQHPENQEGTNPKMTREGRRGEGAGIRRERKEER